MLATSIGLWTPGSFLLSSPPIGPTASREDRNISLCLGVSCAGSQVGGDVDPRTATPTASTLAIQSIGPIGTKALAMFADPVPKRDQKLAWSVVPMFAMGGAGIEMRFAWW